MNLSNRLTFSLVFSVLLVAAFTLVVAPAMAQETVTYFGTRTDATADAAGKWEVTFKFSEGGSFSKGNFTSVTGEGDAAVTSYNISLSNVALTKAQFDAATYAGNLLTVPIAVGEGAPGLTFTVTGFDEGRLDATTAEADAATLAVADAHLGPKEYRVYAVTETGPVMPTSVTPEILADIPNLEDFFFVGGGTIDLKLTGTGKDSRRIVINEVMWAVDNAEVGDLGYTTQQWIEIYNPTSIPVADDTISLVFTNNPSGLNPPAAIAAGTADRLTNIPSYVDTWNVKGQNGSSILSEGQDAEITGADPMFISMYRNDTRGGGEGSGSSSSNWSASDTNRPYVPGFVGTPGAKNTRASVPGTRPAPSAANPAMDKVLINEVYNAKGGDANNKNDWLELRARKATNLENWTLSYVNSNSAEREIMRFPKRTIPAGAIWLIVNTDPTETGVNLAPGNDVTIGEAANQSPGRGTAKYWKLDNFKIPNDMGEDALLILRRGKGWERWQSRDRLEDVVGTGTFSKWTRNTASPQNEPHSGNPAQIWDTKIFPLNGQNPKDYHKDHADRLLHNDNKFVAGNAWARNGNNKGWLRDAGGPAGYRGGIGYDRAANTDANGTPGYDNGAYKKDGGDATSNVIISEIMYAHQGTAQAAPQWIELYNPSSTLSVNLHDFRLTISNHDQTVDADGNMADFSGKGTISVLLKDYSIPPKQTVLIVSATARREEVSIPDNRVYNAFNKNKGEFGMKVRGDSILNPYGFNITLHAKGHEGDVKKRQLGDSIGNLAESVSDRRGSRERFDDVRWNWPNGFNEAGERISVARTHMPVLAEDGGNFTDGVNSGRMAEGWILSSMDGRTDRIDIVYYGAKTDISTPGQTVGQPLPVSLSYFRPTLENGEIVIRWTTESELDNAGFNILRSDSRNGEFKQVNSELVQGAGTTGERNTYKWVDESAKLGVVYYYQIEDVSFAGEHQTLTTTKLKGLISANNKLTTLWGGLKSQD